MSASAGHSPLNQPRGRGDPQVEAELRRRLREKGRLTFAEFMGVALYLPGAGYYQAHAALGRRGDFLTSPETHPAFGALLARLLALMWRSLGEPGEFQAVEYGAGTGSLCLQILTAAPTINERFAASLRYLIVETSDRLREQQRACLGHLGDRVAWASDAPTREPGPGCVLANELVDALPFHRLRAEERGLREVYVGLAADRYCDVAGAPSHPDLETYLREAGTSPPAGAAFEINLAAREWLREAASRLSRGYLITLDFGGSASELYGAASPRGGLKCFHRHGWTDDPYDRPGLLDITAPVDLTGLARAGVKLGLEAVEEVAQGELLDRLGLRQMIGRLDGMDLPVAERERNRGAMEALAGAEGLGRYRALMQSKGAPRLEFGGLAEAPPPALALLEQQPVAWPE